MRTDCTGRSVTRTTGTEIDYRNRIEGLIRMAARETATVVGPGDLVHWFTSQHDRWAAATVRNYRAAILYGIETRVTDPSERAALEEQVHSGPRPKQKGPKRTSARKRKSLPRAEYLKLVHYLQGTDWPDDALIHGFLIGGPILFPRPVEYLDAHIEGTKIFHANAKATNGRANGEVRDRDISHLPPGTIAVLARFLDQLQRALAEAGTWKTLSDRLASRLARVCKILKVGRVCFYTLRHVGMATAKTWMEPREVAAAAGHASIRTATSHYAKRRSGWMGLKIAARPSVASIERVQGHVQIFRPKFQTPSPGQR